MKVLFIDTVHPVLPAKLAEAGFDFHYQPGWSKVKILKNIFTYDGLILRSKIKVDKKFIDAAANLKFIGRVGSGLENIDVKYAETKGIKCLNSPEGNRDAVGEHTLGLLLALMNNICRAHRQIVAEKWLREANRGVEIKGKTIGIIGYGNMGSAFAQRLTGFEANVIAYDKYKKGFSSAQVQECTMKKIFNEADIVSIHLPLTPETKYLVNDEFINKFKKNIYFINTARGPIVNTKDLVKNMKSGKVIGAALDVIEYEDTALDVHFTKIPAAFKYLLGCGNAILTPHVAGWTTESKIKLAEVLAEKIIGAFGGKHVQITK